MGFRCIRCATPPLPQLANQPLPAPFAGILVNLALVALIAWGASQLWLFGLLLCVAYTAAVFYTAHRFRRLVKFPLAHDVLMLIGVGGIAVCGIVLAVNTLGCEPTILGLREAEPQTGWSLPPDGVSAVVAAWAVDTSPDAGSVASFVHVSGGDAAATFMSGANESGIDRLWLVEASGGSGDGSTSIGQLRQPASFVAIGSSACFTALDDALPAAERHAAHVHCCDAGGSCRRLEPAESDMAPRSPRALQVDGGRLWFRADAPFGVSPVGVAYEADEALATLALRSQPTLDFPPPPPPLTPAANPEACDVNAADRRVAGGALAMGVLPALIAVGSVWRRLQTPSMAAGVYIGLTALVATIAAIADPGGAREGAVDEMLRWWLVLFSAA